MRVSHDAVFLEDQFMETDDRHEGGRGQTSCVGCDCVGYGEDSNVEEESKIGELAPKTESIIEVYSVAVIISVAVNHINLPGQPTYKEIFLQILPIPVTKRQVKSVGKVAYCLCAASLLAGIK